MTLAIAVSSLLLRPEHAMSSRYDYADNGALLIHEALPTCKDAPDAERGGFAPDAQDGGCAPEDLSTVNQSKTKKTTTKQMC